MDTCTNVFTYVYRPGANIESGPPQALLDLSFETDLFSLLMLNQVGKADGPASLRDLSACFGVLSAGNYQMCATTPDFVCACVFWASNLSPQTSHMRKAPSELCPQPQQQL